MGFQEGLFWVGLTVFGTALYFVVERASKRTRVVAIVLAVLGIAAMGYSVYAHYSSAPKMPLWGWLVALTWLLFGLDYYDRRIGSGQVHEATSEMKQAQALAAVQARSDLNLDEHDPKVYLEPLNAEFVSTGIMAFEISNRGQRVNVAHAIVVQPISCAPAICFEYIDHLDMAERRKIVPTIKDGNPFSTSDILRELRKAFDEHGQLETMELPFEIRLGYEDVTRTRKFQTVVKMAYSPVAENNARDNALKQPPRNEYKIVRVTRTTIRRLV
jgi:hypothetical protein